MEQQKKESKTMAFKPDPDLAETIREKAKTEDRTVSYIINRELKKSLL